MIHPSYTELIQAINSNSEDDDNTMLLNSRYSLVLATSKRARQLIAGEKPLVEGAEGKKALSAAIDEFYQGKVKILAEPAEAFEKPVQEPADLTEGSEETKELLSVDAADTLEDAADGFEDEDEEDFSGEDFSEEDFSEEESDDSEETEEFPEDGETEE